MRAQLRWTALAVLLAALVLVGAGVFRASALRELRLPLEDRRTSGVLASGFHALERDDRGAYRWTDGDARALLAMPGAGRATLISLLVGPAVPGHPPPTLTLDIGGPSPVMLVIREEPRRYLLLAPPAASIAGRVDVRLASATFSFPPDQRALGVRVEALGASSLGGPVLWPALLDTLLQIAAVALVVVAAARSGARGLWLAALAVAVAALLALALWLAPAVAPVYQARMAIAAALLAGLTAVALPLLERNPAWLGPPAEARVLWGATLLACGLRLAGALFPPFAAYDLGLNLDRLFATVGGALVATNESFEFGGGVTVYPSGPYLILMPGLLVGLSPKLAVQGGIALIDGLATLGVAALGQAFGSGVPSDDGAWTTGERPLPARRSSVVVRQSLRAVPFAALAYAALPIGLTTLWYGHTAQAFGQALMAPLALALLLGLRSTPGPWPWLWAGVLMAMALLSHIGVSILALAWLGLLWLAVTLRELRGARREAPDASVVDPARGGAATRLGWGVWRRLTATLLLGGMVGLVFVYGPALAAHLDTLAGLDFGGEGVAPKPSYNLIAKAFWIAYTPLGLTLALGGATLIRPRMLPPGADLLLGTWVGAAGLFWAVEMVTGLQVRYLVFLAPLACLAIGLALAWLAAHGRGGRWLAWALAAALVLQGAAMWLGGIFGGAAPSMVPLLR